MNIYDNIGCSFEYQNEQIVLTGPLPGYLSFSENHVGSTVPYLARNINNNSIDFEVGIADIVKQGNSIVAINRTLSTSSDNGNLIDFSKNGNKQFYLFVNTSNFNTGFNNVLVYNENFDVKSTKTSYIIHFNHKDSITAKLPKAADNKSLTADFRTVGSGVLIIRDDYGFELVLSGENRYTKLLSTGDAWIELKDSPSDTISAQSSDFNILSSPSGNSLSFQYKLDADKFGGSDLFWDTDKHQLLFGSSTDTGAKNIIPSTGHHPVIFNQTRYGSDFIVYGTGVIPGYPEKNLYFSSSGKLGINMPSGLKPATALHIINTLCREGMRLENWGSCFPADITLYQNSTETPSDTLNDTSFAQITFAAKNSSNVKRNFAQIVAKRKSVSSSKGELQIVVGDTASAANSGVVTVSTNPDQTQIQHGSANISVTNASSNVSVGSSYFGVSANRLNIDAGSSTNPINVTGVVNINNRLKLNYINEPNALLAIDNNNNIIASTGFQIPGIYGSYWPFEPGRSNMENIGGKDVTWERYNPRRVLVDELCLNAFVTEIAFAEVAPMEEFVNGDQIAVYNDSNKTLQYRTINQVLTSGDGIVGLQINQSVNLSGLISVYSTSRGGILNNTIYTSGIVSDGTSVTISTRPNTSTVFNTKQKNIDFVVYGAESVPAFNVLANASVEDKASGVYYTYATQSTDFTGKSVVPFASRIGNNGYGLNNSSNNAVNYKEAADTGIWLNRVSAVGTNGKPSYYGTYDQNGNVYEWVEDSITNGSASSLQYVCGGSWRTFTPDGLRSYVPTPRSSGLDDVGFRIASQAGFKNDTLESRLGLKFVRIDNAGNLPDTDPLYTEDFDNRFSLNSEPWPIDVQNLGVVNHVYNIGSFEVTNSQYTEFLNSVATGLYPDGLYDTRMSNSNIGGIARSGNGSSVPYSYTIKDGMAYMPVVFVNYLSAIRFVNWLSNGGLSGTDGLNSLEYGSYALEGETLSITRNRNKGYYLPSLHEWHKAAYYIPINETVRNPKSVVTIRSNAPYEYASGQISSLSVSGYIYTDNLIVGNSGDPAGQLIKTSTQNQNFNILLGPDNVVTNTNETTLIESVYRSYISNTGIQLATNGNTILINNINPMSTTTFTPSGVVVSSKITIAQINPDGSFGSGIVLTPSGTEILDGSGNIIEGGSVPGPNGGFVYKDINTNNLFASNKILIEEFVDGAITGYYPKLANTNNNSVIHNDINGYLSSSPFFTVGVAPEGSDIDDNKIVSVFTSDTGVAPATLCANRVLIGPVLESFKGSLLQHNGTAPATWTANDFFKADGAKWTRNIKRAIKILSYNEIQFIELDESEGGTGDVTIDDIENEFAYTDTIAIYNKDREVYYVKIAKTVLVDNAESYGAADSLWDTEINRNNKIFRFIPPLPEEWVASDPITTSIGSIRLGYAFSIQKGAYFSMLIEPSAIRAFDIEGVYDDEDGLPYPITRFKPSTTNTISIKPNISTSFNTLAEDIDFAIYGYRKTLLNRYEPDWFNKDDSGLPTGIIPAFKMHAHINNSVLGSLESGVFRDTIVESENIASGIQLDLNPKLTINMMGPYKIVSLTGITNGFIKYNPDIELNKELEKEYGFEIPVTGTVVTGSLDLTTYADLSVGGTTYTSGLIVNNLAILPVYTGEIPIDPSFTGRAYVPNYPLTINSDGQVISLVPPPVPTAPDAPVNVVGQPKNSVVILTWDAPENNGGSKITSYVVEFSSDLGSTWFIFDQVDEITGLPAHPDTNTTRTVTNLINDTSYVFRVRAINAIGKGDYSVSSSAIIPKNWTPTMPRDVKIDGDNSGENRLTINPNVTWIGPAIIPNGTAIAGYDVYYFLDIPDENGNAISYEKATWIKAGNTLSPVTLTKTIQNIPTDKYVVFGVVALSDTDLGHGIESPKAIYRSPGVGVDPRNPTAERTSSSKDYNFGTILFTGSC